MSKTPLAGSTRCLKECFLLKHHFHGLDLWSRGYADDESHLVLKCISVPFPSKPLALLLACAHSAAARWSVFKKCRAASCRVGQKT